MTSSGGLSADRFYGPPSAYRRVVPSRSAAAAVENRPGCHLTNANRLLGPPSGWKTFARQQDALDYLGSRATDDGYTPFAYEQRVDGQRRFMVAHPETFWHRDSRKPPAERHTYEIVAERRPCKLYFDLEYDRALNPDADGPRMVRTFARIVAALVRRRFGAECDADRDVLDLDSSTADKFSRHLIFQSAVFADNAHAGRFVRFACAVIRAFQASADDDDDDDVRLDGGVTARDVLGLEVVGRGGDRGLFCDESVYSRNRHFRLYRSSKWNKKNAPLVLSAENGYRPPDVHHCGDCFDKQVFLRSLITFGCGGRVLLNFGGDFPAADAGCPRLQPPRPNDQGECRSSYAGSPFPRVDGFIAELVFPGKIFRNHYFPAANRLVYSIVKNRYCGNVRRQHKRNNVKYVVDLNRMHWYQKCYDPDCRRYRSEGAKLPDEICFEYGCAGRETDGLSDSQLVEIADTALLTFD